MSDAYFNRCVEKDCDACVRSCDVRQDFYVENLESVYVSKSKKPVFFCIITTLLTCIIFIAAVGVKSVLTKAVATRMNNIYFQCYLRIL